MLLLDDDFYYEKLKRKVTEALGFQAQHYGDKHLKRRFMVRMRAVGARTYKEYMGRFESDPAEYPKLLNALTVNVTEWFRNPGVYRVLEKRVIPNIAKTNLNYGADLRFKEYKGRVIPDIANTNRTQNRRFLRMWSVGCSDGKEPYSLAMCVKDALEGAEGVLVTIFAWDIDDEMLKKARSGLYKPDDMKGLEQRHIEKYFVEEDGGYRVRPEIRAMVNFEKKDINKDRKRIWIDLITCRNVVIYLTSKRKAELYLELYQCLRPGGYFVMGKSEALLGESRKLFKTVDNVNRVYQK